MKTESIIQAGRDKGLIIRRIHGVLTIKEPSGESYVPRDSIDLQQYVEKYKRNVVRATSIDDPYLDDKINQIIERTPRS